MFKVIGWVVRDNRPWPRDFGDSGDLALTTSAGGLLSLGKGPAEKAREKACESMKKKQNGGQIPQDRHCPTDAPIIYPVNTVPARTGISDVLPVSFIVTGVHSAIGWLLVLLTVLRRKFS